MSTRFTISDHVAIQAQSHPDRIAVEVLEGATLTYSDVWRRAQGLAAALDHVEPGPNGRMVGILLGNGADALLSYLACQINQCTAVPISNRLAPPEVNYVMNDSGASALMSGGQFLDIALRCAREVDARLVNCDDVATPDVLEIGPIGESGIAEDLAAVFYTSGTTGFPKGAAMTNHVWLLRSMWWGWQFTLSDQDVMLVPGPIFHMSFGGLSLGALMLGGRIRIMSQFDPERAYEELAERSTFVFLVPSMSAMVLDTWRQRQRLPMRSARYVLSSGAPLPERTLREMMDAFPNASIADAYGWTEAGWVTCEVKQRNTLRPNCVGWPAFGTEVVIVDEDRRRCPVGVAGEVAARSPVPFARYLNRPEATAEAWHEGYQLSGDIGILDEDGRIRIVDRKNDMIVTGGENVYTAEVERVLMEHPAVSDCAVIGRPDDRWGEAVVGVVVGSEGTTLEPDEIRSFCRERLAGYKCPKDVLVVEELPRNSMGKIQKFRVREMIIAPEAVAQSV